jgi:hypothetical protein
VLHAVGRCVVNVERQHRSGTTIQERICNISFSLTVQEEEAAAKKMEQESKIMLQDLNGHDET